MPYDDAYIARCRDCHEMVGAQVDNPRHADDVASQIREWIRDGYFITRQSAATPLPPWCVCDDTKVLPQSQ